MKKGSVAKDFGLLLAHFLGDKKAALSVSAAAGLTGLPVGVARSALALLETGGILRGPSGRSKLYSPNVRSGCYWRCRKAYLVRK